MSTTDEGTQFSNDGAAVLERQVAVPLPNVATCDIVRVYEVERCAKEILARGFTRVSS